MKNRKLVIELDETTFAYLEMLAFGIQLEQKTDDENGLSEWSGFDKSKNDFAPGVRALLTDVANSLATGVRRPGAWERQVVDQLTGWQGTYNKGMLAARFLQGTYNKEMLAARCLQGTYNKGMLAECIKDEVGEKS